MIGWHWPTVTVSQAGWYDDALVFPQGQIPSGSVPVFADTPTQATVLRRWPDGSVRHVVLTANLAVGAHVVGIGATASGSFTPTAPELSAIVNQGSVDFEAVFTDTGYGNPGAFRNGPLVRETLQITRFAGAPGALGQCLAHFYLRSYSDGTHRVAFAIDNSVVHPDAGHVVGALTLYVNGQPIYTRTCEIAPGVGTAKKSPSYALAIEFSQSQAGFFTRADVNQGATCNDYIRATSGLSTGRVMKAWKFDTDTLALCTAGGAQWEPNEDVSFERISFLIPYGSVGVRRFPVNDHQAARYTVDLETFYQAGAMFRPVSGIAAKPFNHTVRLYAPNPQMIGHADHDWEIFNGGLFNKRMSDGGDRPELTMQPEWCLLWQLYQTPEYYDFMLEQADQFGAFSQHAHTADGTAITEPDLPDFYFGSRPYLTEGQTQQMYLGHEGAGNGSSHMPDPCFIPYLVTGDRWYAEQLKDGACFGIMNQTEERRSGYFTQSADKCLLWYGANEKRSALWAFRDLVHALAYVPDSDPIRPWLERVYQNNVAEEAALLQLEPDTLGYPVLCGAYLRNFQITGDRRTFGGHESNVFEEAYTAWVGIDSLRQGYPIAQTYMRKACEFVVKASLANDGTNTDRLELLCQYAFFPFTNAYPFPSFPSFKDFWQWNVVNTWGPPPGAGLYRGANGHAVTYAPYGRIVLLVAAQLGIAGAQELLDEMETARPNYVSEDWQATDEYAYGRQVTAITLDGPVVTVPVPPPPTSTGLRAPGKPIAGWQ